MVERKKVRIQDEYRGQGAAIAAACRDLKDDPVRRAEYERASSLRKRLLAAYNAQEFLSAADEAELEALGAKRDTRAAAQANFRYALAELIDRAEPQATAKSSYTLKNVDDRLALLRARPDQADPETKREIDYLVALRGRKFPGQ